MNEKIRQLFLMKTNNSKICDFIASHLTKVYNFITIKSKAKEDEIYVYEGGIYVECGKEIIKQQCEELVGSFLTSHMVNEIIHKVERKTYKKREVLFDVPMELICLENGILNLLTKEVQPHNPDIIFINKLPINYKKNAYCNRFLEFLSETLYEEDMRICQEWFGYMLWRRYSEKKALVCIGPTDTGKTVFLSVMFNFLGKNNISSIDLHALTPNNRFATEHLFNKYANICDELTSDDLKDVSKFKKLTGRSVMDAEPKFKDRFSFENYAKLVFATNKMPILQGAIEDPESYYDRWVIFVFDNKVQESEKNKKLTEEICNNEELSGIMNWSLEGLARLMSQKKFSLYRPWEENERIMMAHGESVYSFAVKGLEVFEGVTRNEEMYEKYIEYCSLNSKIPEGQISFGRKFKPKNGRRINDGKFNGWRGIKPKNVLLDIE